jgi:hypothetical protein
MYKGEIKITHSIGNLKPNTYWLDVYDTNTHKGIYGVNEMGEGVDEPIVVTLREHMRLLFEMGYIIPVKQKANVLEGCYRQLDNLSSAWFISTGTINNLPKIK